MDEEDRLILDYSRKIIKLETLLLSEGISVSELNGLKSTYVFKPEYYDKKGNMLMLEFYKDYHACLEKLRVNSYT